MKAMILAAGLGTRLRPLTEKRPKALMPVANKPILARVIEYLKAHGVSEIVVNAHHHHGQLLNYIDSGRPFGLPIQVRVEEEILGTGGGIKNTEDFWDEAPFLVINGDVLTDIDCAEAYENHLKSGALVTLVLHDCEPFNQIQVDDRGNILDIAKQNLAGRLAFTGIHIISPDLLSHIPRGVFYDIIASYRNLISSGNQVRGFISRSHHWRDIGSLQSYIEANRELAASKFMIHPGCEIDPSAKLEDWAVVGEKSVLEKGAILRASILWEGVKVRKDVRIVNSVVTASREVTADLVGQLY
jgi:NDP-sugar pyrophosphorylase family protein